MRKPNDMKIRQYVNHLRRINFDELPLLPPATVGQQLSDDEMIDIVMFGIPKSWTKEMDRQDFDPYRLNVTLIDLVNFCERLESAEDFTPGQAKKKDSGKNHGSSPKKSKHSKGKPKGDGKWCDYHKTDTHDTSECHVLKKKNNEKGNGNKTWQKKSDDAKKFAKKEINSIVKKVTKQVSAKVKKDLNTLNKRKKKDDESDDESTDSLNMIDQEMKDLDKQLKEFDFVEADKHIEM